MKPDTDPESPVGGGPINILIVDDEPINLTVLETVLDDPGYRLVRAESANQALLELVDGDFALLILDIRMPGMTGFELAEMVKERKKTAQVPIIFLTAYYNEDQHVMEGYGAGAVDYLHKPLNAAILRSKVAVFAELYRNRRECGQTNLALHAQMSERRRAEEQLRELNETLEHRVTERTKALVQASSALQESGERYRSLFDGSLDAIFSLSLDGHFETTNPATLRLTGYTLEQLKTIHFLELCAPEQRQAAQDAFRAVLCRPCHTMDTAILTATGERRELVISGAPATVDSKVVGVSCIARDVTDQKQAEEALRESEGRFRALLESAPDAMVIIDREGTIALANAQTERLFGYSREELLGQRAEMLIPARFHSQYDGHREGYFSASPLRGMGSGLELLGQRKDGTEFPIEVNLSPMETDQGMLVSSAIRDITERSRMEQLLIGQAEELSDLHRRKDEFLAMLSHELRSPLAPITNAVQLLGLHRDSETPIQQAARGIIERQIGQMQRLVDDLLDVSRTTTGRIQLRREHVAVSGIVEGAVETIRPLIEQRRHELAVSVPPEPIWLHADAARLEQVLVNLLTNAAKFTEEGGHLWLSVQKEGEQCVLRVRDTGVGIAPPLLPRIFDLFTQSERSLDRSQGGMGIGLALVQRLTELHDGSVEAHSQLGRGSEFIVRLPVSRMDAPHQTLPVAENGQPNTRSLRVLVVDDNVDTALSFSTLLSATGHEVRTAHDGPTAVQVALDYRPDLIVLDIGLPGLNGYEVATLIRKHPLLQDVVLVALTGYGQESDRLTSKAAGFDHHLAKPARLEQLQRILATLTEHGD
ncbi:MAG: PAS domain S-box protein [Candidatus Eisenbacteria bacterium]